MRPFVYERATNPRRRRIGRASVGERQHARRISRRRHDAVRSDEARRHAAEPVIDINPLAATTHGRIELSRQRPAAWRAGAHGGCGRPCRDQKPISGHRAIAEARREPATPQHGEPRRQCPAAHPLHLFPRRLLRGLQQAQSRLRLRGDGRRQPQPRRARHQRPLHRDLSRRFRPGADRARRRGRDRRHRRQPHDSVRDAASQARRHAGQGNRSAARRTDRRRS